MTSHEILVETRVLLSVRENWCQGSLARLHDGKQVGLLDGEAFCIVGAIMYCSPYRYVSPHTEHGAEMGETIAVLTKAMESHPGWSHFASLYQFNDAVTYEDIITLLDEALREKHD